MIVFFVRHQSLSLVDITKVGQGSAKKNELPQSQQFIWSI
jgi:hypothetical protein